MPCRIVSNVKVEFDSCNVTGCGCLSASRDLAWRTSVLRESKMEMAYIRTLLPSHSCSHCAEHVRVPPHLNLMEIRESNFKIGRAHV